MSITRPSGSGPPRAANLLFEVAALDVLHHQVMAILSVEAVGDRGDRLMLQLREGVGFAREVFVGLDPLLLVDEVIDHLFDRARAIGQALVVRQVDHPHSAAAEQAFDSVADLQNGAGRERLVRQSAGCASTSPCNQQTQQSRKYCPFHPPALAATINSRAAAIRIVVAAQDFADRLDLSTCAVSPSLHSISRSPRLSLSAAPRLRPVRSGARRASA